MPVGEEEVAVVTGEGLLLVVIIWTNVCGESNHGKHQEEQSGDNLRRSEEILTNKLSSTALH